MKNKKIKDKKNKKWKNKKLEKWKNEKRKKKNKKKMGTFFLTKIKKEKIKKCNWNEGKIKRYRKIANTERTESVLTSLYHGADSETKTVKKVKNAKCKHAKYAKYVKLRKIT